MRTDMGFSNLDFRISIEQRLCGACILCDVPRLQQPRDENDAPRTGCDDISQVLELDATNAKDRQRDGSVDSLDIGESDGSVIRLRRRREKRTKANVIGTFSRGLRRLLKAVGRFADEAVPAGGLASFGNGQVVLADVHACRADFARDLRVIIDDERDLGFTCHISQPGREAHQFPESLLLPTQLDNVDSSVDHCASHPDCVSRVHVAEINDSVEPAGMQSAPGAHSCRRVRVGFNSNWSEAIKRSTNPVS